MVSVRIREEQVCIWNRLIRGDLECIRERGGQVPKSATAKPSREIGVEYLHFSCLDVPRDGGLARNYSIWLIQSTPGGAA